MSYSLLSVYKHTCRCGYCSNAHCMLQVTQLATVKHPQERLRALQRWQRDGGVVIMGYEMYRILSQAQKTSDEEKKELKSILVNPGAVTL